MAVPASADDAAVEATPEAQIEATWRAWVAERGVRRSTLAITRDGVPVGAFGIGREADAVVPIASLSKAITGACILALIEEGAITYDTPLGEVFAARPDLLGPDLLGNGADVSIEALLTQTAGLDVDRTQSVFNPTLWGGADLHDQITALALGRPLGAPQFFYNNENYAILGSVIMEVTGQNVEAACGPRVLYGLHTAAPDRRTGGSLAWGGWAMSVADYAQFASRLQVTDDWPGAPLGGIYYGPGVFMRDTARGTNLWHFGGFCLFGMGDHGAYFFVLDNGWGVVVSYDICVNNDQAIALDQGLAAAAYSTSE